MHITNSSWTQGQNKLTPTTATQITRLYTKLTQWEKY
jgi:hypothetical protein